EALPQLPSPSPHLIFTGLHAQTTNAVERRLEGSTLSIQCPYTAQMKQNRKAWCRMRDGQCESLVETTKSTGKTQATKQKAKIVDDPMHRTMSITMTNLQLEDSGTYFCAYYHSYQLQYIPIKAISLNVFKGEYLHHTNSSDVSVQCPYRAQDYRAVSKAWCKEAAGNACTILVTTNKKPTSFHRASQEGKVTIQDDTQQGIVTITMEKLQTQDSGVYWCALYEHAHLFRMVEVTLSISEASAGTTLAVPAGTSQTTASGNTPAPNFCSNVKTFILLSVVLGILFILALISLIALYVRQCKQLKRKGMWRLAMPRLDSPERMEGPKDDSKDLKYVTLNFESLLIPEDPLYCNVEPSQTHRKPKDENVEYAIIELK
ncbi:PIGR protein, partial [Corythaixoides concolor]|nr:PIGR protein [Corythaixoides concolor]